jgi:hypothetical protein
MNREKDIFSEKEVRSNKFYLFDGAEQRMLKINLKNIPAKLTEK